MEQAENEVIAQVPAQPVVEEPATADGGVAGNVAEQPVSYRDDLAATVPDVTQSTKDDTQKGADDALATGTADEAKTESSAEETVEAQQFAERAFVADENERGVQSSAGDRIFVAGVGFVEVSHPVNQE